MEQALAIRIKFRRHDGTIVEDTVRGFFNHEALLEPYARNTVTPAAVLTEHSWIPLCDIVAFIDEGGLLTEYREAEPTAENAFEDCSEEEIEAVGVAANDTSAWVTFCKRTEDPKLGYIERLLDERSIPHRRHGESWHATILQVPEEFETQAWDLLSLVVDHDEAGNVIRLDDIEDDDPMFDEFRRAD